MQFCNVFSTVDRWPEIFWTRRVRKVRWGTGLQRRWSSYAAESLIMWLLLNCCIRCIWPGRIFSLRVRALTQLMRWHCCWRRRCPSILWWRQGAQTQDMGSRVWDQGDSRLGYVWLQPQKKITIRYILKTAPGENKDSSFFVGFVDVFCSYTNTEYCSRRMLGLLSDMGVSRRTARRADQAYGGFAWGCVGTSCHCGGGDAEKSRKWHLANRRGCDPTNVSIAWTFDELVPITYFASRSWGGCAWIFFLSRDSLSSSSCLDVLRDVS